MTCIIYISGPNVYFIETSLVFLRNKNILYDIKQCTVRQSETICIQIMQSGR